jgi:hypothetical protein
MPKRPRLTRRMPVAITEDAHRRLRRFAAEAGLSHDLALTFLLENLDRITDDNRLAHRLRPFAKAHAAAGD